LWINKDTEHDEPVGPIREFAEELQKLRTTAGTPSFRKMAARSGSISHTTLHEAATGLRFPSWETTREFVRVCGGDEASWRVRWTAAREKAVASKPTVTAPADTTTPVPGTEATRLALTLPAPGDPVTQPSNSGGKRQQRPYRRFIGLTGLTTLVVAAATLSAFTAFGGKSAQDRQTIPDDEGRQTTTSSPSTGPLHAGDRSRFIADITIPDGTKVQTGQTFEKIWEIQNAGTVVWRDRYLQRDDLPIDSDTCQTPERIPVGDTLPNERVKIHVRVTAPTTPGTCMVKWKMVDKQGRLLFPTARPVYFLVHVTASATP